MVKLSSTSSALLSMLFVAFNFQSGNGVKVGSMLSTRLISSLCSQKVKFITSGQIQVPEKRAPQTTNVPCGWHRVFKCQDPDYEQCSGKIKFKFLSCDQVKGIQEMFNNPRPRIVGGNNTKRNGYPAILNLFVPVPGVSGFVSQSCSAVIINKYWILSTVTCFRILNPDKRPDIFNVTAGDHDVFNDDGTGREQVRKMNLIIDHPSFNFSKTKEVRFIHHDIALGRVDPPFDLNEFVQPAVLPPKDLELQDGQTTMAVSWGEVMPPYADQPIDLPPGIELNFLMEAEIPVMKNERCSKLWKNYGSAEWVQEFHLCAGYVDRTLPMTCGGDRGGPLYLLENGVQTIVGLLSQSTLSCYNSTLPGIYTRLSYYIDWIEETVKANTL